MVSPGATPAASGLLLKSALDAADAGSGALLIKVEPGTYDIGTGVFQMRDNVDVEGSGEGTTVLVGNGSDVLLAANAELRWLTVVNDGGTNNFADAVSMFASTQGFRMTHVTAIGASNGVQFADGLSGAATIRDCTLRGTGGTSASYGLYENSGTQVHVFNSVLEGTTAAAYTLGGGTFVNTQFIGGLLSSSGPRNCVNSYDGTYTPLDGGCQ